MKKIIFIALILLSISGFAQEDGDTTLKRCPVYITDTATSNNFFIEAMPATITVSRVKGNLTIAIRQKDQYFTMFFRTKKLKNTKYKILNGASSHSALDAKYSFRSGDQVSFVALRSGTVESVFDKEKDLWHLKVNGMISNLVERSVTYYKVRSDFYVR